MPQVRRRALNEAVFRDVNERIAGISIAHRQGEIGIICECSKLGCSIPIQIRFEEYQAARSDPVIFLVAPGHNDPEIERVVADHGTYMLVEKMGAAADEARATADDYQ